MGWHSGMMAPEAHRPRPAAATAAVPGTRPVPQGQPDPHPTPSPACTRSGTQLLCLPPSIQGFPIPRDPRDPRHPNTSGPTCCPPPTVRLLPTPHTLLERGLLYQVPGLSHFLPAVAWMESQGALQTTWSISILGASLLCSPSLIPAGCGGSCKATEVAAWWGSLDLISPGREAQTRSGRGKSGSRRIPPPTPAAPAPRGAEDTQGEGDFTDSIPGAREVVVGVQEIRYWRPSAVPLAL